MLAVLYGPIHMEDGTRVASKAETAFYNGWARLGWCVAISYIIIACCTGRGGNYHFIASVFLWFIALKDLD